VEKCRLRGFASTKVTFCLDLRRSLSSYYEPLCHPTRPGLSFTSCRLIPTAITVWASRVASGLLCLHAVAITPAGPMELVRSYLSIVSGLPRDKAGSAPAIAVAGSAQRSFTLRPARSRSRLATLSIESSDSFVASAIVSIATRWNEPVPRRELHPLNASAFHRALQRQPSLPKTNFMLSPRIPPKMIPRLK
jgi:hypothetical protein